MKGRKQAAPNVLVVDDDEHLVVAITELLRDAGYETKAAYDGHLAIQRLSTAYAPDVIVLDLAMPMVSGFEVLNWMRQHDIQIPVVLATLEDDVRAAEWARS
jgi:CheY-like chemotaxis protein